MDLYMRVFANSFLCKKTRFLRSCHIFCEVDTLVRIFFTIPVTTCTAERSFSSLRRLKTYFRSSMTEERLNNVLILNAYKEDIDQLDLQEIATAFISVNSIFWCLLYICLYTSYHHQNQKSVVTDNFEIAPPTHNMFLRL